MYLWLLSVLSLVACVQYATDEYDWFISCQKIRYEEELWILTGQPLFPTYLKDTIHIFAEIWRSVVKAIFYFGRMTKRGIPPPPRTLTKRGTLLFVDLDVFGVHVVVGIDPTAQQVYALPRYTILHIFTITNCIRTAKRPTACGTSTPLQKAKRTCG